MEVAYNIGQQLCGVITNSMVAVLRERPAGVLPAGTQGFFGAAAASHMGISLVMEAETSLLTSLSGGVVFGVVAGKTVKQTVGATFTRVGTHMAAFGASRKLQNAKGRGAKREGRP